MIPVSFNCQPATVFHRTAVYRVFALTQICLAFAVSGCSVPLLSGRDIEQAQSDVATPETISATVPSGEAAHAMALSQGSASPLLGRIRTKDLWADDKGRPANLYRLTIDQSPICHQLLGALNQPIPPSDFKSYQVKSTGDLFLRNEFSVVWEPLAVSGKEILYHRLSAVDLDGDGKKDWVVRESHLVGYAPGYMDEIYWVAADPREAPLSEIWNFIVGDRKRDGQILYPGNVVAPWANSDPWQTSAGNGEHWVDLVEIDRQGFYLSMLARSDLTFQSLSIEVFGLSQRHKGLKVCEVTSDYEFSELTIYGVKE